MLTLPALHTAEVFEGASHAEAVILFLPSTIVYESAVQSQQSHYHPRFWWCAAGRQKAIPAALYCALGAGGAHFLSQRLHLGHAFRRTLVRMDLLDDEGAKKRSSARTEVDYGQ